MKKGNSKPGCIQRLEKQKCSFTAIQPFTLPYHSTLSVFHPYINPCNLYHLIEIYSIQHMLTHFQWSLAHISIVPFQLKFSSLSAGYLASCPFLDYCLVFLIVFLLAPLGVHHFLQVIKPKLQHHCASRTDQEDQAF